MKRMLIAALAFAAIMAAPAQSGPPRITQSGSIDNMSKILPVHGISSQDAQFLQDLAAGNWLEITTSEMANDRASGDWTKHFANDMITDHKAAQTEVVQLAHDKGIDVEKGPPREIKTMADRLSRCSASQFDDEYRALQIKSHKMAQDALSKEIKNGHDADVRALAVKMLPIVKMHLRMAIERGTMTQH